MQSKRTRIYTENFYVVVRKYSTSNNAITSLLFNLLDRLGVVGLKDQSKLNYFTEQIKTFLPLVEKLKLKETDEEIKEQFFAAIDSLEKNQFMQKKDYPERLMTGLTLIGKTAMFPPLLALLETFISLDNDNGSRKIHSNDIKRFLLLLVLVGKHTDNPDDFEELTKQHAENINNLEQRECYSCKNIIGNTDVAYVAQCCDGYICHSCKEEMFLTKKCHKCECKLSFNESSRSFSKRKPKRNVNVAEQLKKVQDARAKTQIQKQIVDPPQSIITTHIPEHPKPTVIEYDAAEFLEDEDEDEDEEAVAPSNKMNDDSDDEFDIEQSREVYHY